jgi:hypothetical protein
MVMYATSKELCLPVLMNKLESVLLATEVIVEDPRLSA